MMRVAFAASLCACSFHVQDVTSTGDDAGRIDAPPGIDDPDGDGVDSSTDNCPTVANPDQADEDHDGIGDACDPCPQDPAPTGDRDGDGIGDTCDPHIDDPSDRLAYWNGFGAGQILPAEWHALVGSDTIWHIAGGALVIDGDDTAPAIRLEVDRPDHTIDIGLDVTTIHDGVQVVSALADVSTAGDLFFHCGVHFDAHVREFWEYNGGWISLGTDTSDPPSQPGAFRVITGLTPGPSAFAGCDIPASGTAHHLSSSTVNDGQTGVGIRVRNLAVSIRYVAVYTR